MRLHDTSLTKLPYGQSCIMTWALTLAVMATVQQVNGTLYSQSSQDTEEVQTLPTNTREEGSETKTHLYVKDVEQGYSGLERDVDDPQGVYPELTTDEAVQAAKDTPKDTEGGDEETDRDDEETEDVVRPPAPVKIKTQKRAANVLPSKRPRQWPPDVMYNLHDIPGPPKWTGQRSGNVRHQQPLPYPRDTVQVTVKKVKVGDTKNSKPRAVYQNFIASKESNDTAVTSSSILTKSPPLRRRRNIAPETADQPTASKLLQKGPARHINPPVQRWKENKEGDEKGSEDDNDDSDSDTVINEDKLQERHSQVKTNGVFMESNDIDDEHNDVKYMPTKTSNTRKVDGDIAENHEDNNDDDSYKDGDFLESEDYIDGESKINKKGPNTIRFKSFLASQNLQTPGLKQKVQTEPHWMRSHKAPVARLVAFQDQEGEYFDKKNIDYHEHETDSAEEDPLHDSLADILEGKGTSAKNLYDAANSRVRRRTISPAASAAATPNRLHKRSYDLRDVIREIDAEEDEEIDTDDDIENMITGHINDDENEENDEMEEMIREERGAANVDERKTVSFTPRPKATANSEANSDVTKIAGEKERLRDAGRDVRSQKRERKHADHRDERVDFTRRKRKRDDSHVFPQAIDTELSLVPPEARVLPSITPSRADTLHTMEFFRDEMRIKENQKKKRGASGEWWENSPPEDSNHSGGLNVRATHALSIDTIQQKDIDVSPADDHTYNLQEEPQEKSDTKGGHDFALEDETVKQEKKGEEEDYSNDLIEKHRSQTLRRQRRQANGNGNNNIPDDSNDTGGFNIRFSHGRPHVHYDNENSASKLLDFSLQQSDESELGEVHQPIVPQADSPDAPTIVPVSPHDNLHDLLNIPRNSHDVSPTTFPKGLDQQAISTGSPDAPTIAPVSPHDNLHDLLNIPRNSPNVSPTTSPEGLDQQEASGTASASTHGIKKHISFKTPLSSTLSVAPDAASDADENKLVKTKTDKLSSKPNQSKPAKNLDRDAPSLHAWYRDGNVTAYIHSHGANREEGIVKGKQKKKRSMTTANIDAKRLDLERSAHHPAGKFETFLPNIENFADKAVLVQNANLYTLESAADVEDHSRSTPYRSRRSTRPLMLHPMKPRQYRSRKDGSGIMGNSRQRRSADVGSQTVTSHAPIKRRWLPTLDVATRYKDADRTLDDILNNILPEATGGIELTNTETEAMMGKQNVHGALTEEEKELKQVMGVLTNYQGMPSVVLDIRKGEGRLVSPRDAKFDKIVIRNEREAPKARPFNHRAKAKHLSQEEKKSLNSDLQKEEVTDEVDEEKAPGFEIEGTRREKISQRNTSEREKIMGKEMTRGVLKRRPSSSLLGSADNEETARIERELQELNNRALAPSPQKDYAESGARRWYIQHEHQAFPKAAAVDTRLKEEAARRDLVTLQTAAAVDNAVRKALQKVKERIRRTRNVNGDIIENLLRSDDGELEATGGKEEGDTDGSDVYDSEEEEDRRPKRNSPFVDEGIDGDVVLDAYRKKRSAPLGEEGTARLARTGSQRKDIGELASGLAKAARAGARAGNGAGVRAGAEVGANVEPEVSEETDLNVDDMLLGIKKVVNNVEKESHKVQRILRKVDTFTGRYNDEENEDDGEDEEEIDDEKVDEEVDDEDDDYVASDEAFADTIIVSAVDKAGQLKTHEGNHEPLVFEEDDDGPNSGYSPWNEWSSCSVSCGFGRRHRSRSCEDISRCTAGNQEEDICMLGPCK